MHTLSLFRYIIKQCIAVLLLSSIVTITPVYAGDDDDFDAFLKELEKALGQSDDDDDTDKAGPKSQPFSGREESSKPTEKAKVEKVTIEQEPKEVSKDPEVLFVNPPTRKITKGKDQRTEPVPEAIEAFSTIKNRLETVLASMSKKITADFTPEYQEEFLITHQALIDTVTVALDNIESRKVLKRLFLCPPAGNKTLVDSLKKTRESIISLLKKLEDQDKKFVVTAKEEEEVGETEALLKKLAKPTPVKKKKVAPIERAPSAHPEEAGTAVSKDRTLPEESTVPSAHPEEPVIFEENDRASRRTAPTPDQEPEEFQMPMPETPIMPAPMIPRTIFPELPNDTLPEE